jgi:hypothetical protein
LVASAQRRDVAGRIVQWLLTALGLHAFLAVGFTLYWGGRPIVSYRHPLAGLLLILLALGLRWLISPAWRRGVTDGARRVAACVRGYAGGAAAIPWRAAWWWVFLPALVVYQSNNRTIGSGDTAPMVPTALSILRQQDIALDEFIHSEAPPYYVCRIDVHYYTRFGLGPAVLALPFVELARCGGGDLDDPVMGARLEKVIASVVAAATGALVFLALLRVAEPAPAAVLTTFFVLGSQNWSIASQALWQHGPVAACAAGSLWLELHSAGRGTVWVRLMQGILLGFSLGCRPTAGLLVLAFAALIAVREWRWLPAYLAGVLLAYGPFMWLHVHAYHSWLGPYVHAASEAKWSADLGLALAGNLVSPARGVLLYQPLVILAAVGLWPRFARRIGVPVAAALAAWCLLHLLVVSCYTHWWGGHAWGPRFLTELMPALTVLSAPATAWLWRGLGGRVLIGVLIAWSIGLQALGVYSPGAQRWMAQPVDVDQAPQRLWDWSDPPFLYPWRKGPQAR